MRIRELAGFAGGALLAPLAALGSFIRHARVFHPAGVVYRAEVVPIATEGAAGHLAKRLAGPAFARISAGLHRRKERLPDVLGVAVRFRHDTAVWPEPEKGDQDMLFATARSPLSLPFAALTTSVHSFLWDPYYAIGRFDAGKMGLTKWRLSTPRIRYTGMTREEGLEKAVQNGEAVLELQARRVRLGSRYEPIARIRLIERVDVDQEALRFSPFRSGRGIVPRGFVNALRILVYPASQWARPEHR